MGSSIKYDVERVCSLSRGEIKTLIDLYYFIMNICTHFSYYCCGVFLLRGISKTFFHHFPTFPVNPRQHVAFD